MIPKEKICALLIYSLLLSLVKAETTSSSADATATANGCPLPTSTAGKGFNVDFWDWEYADVSPTYDSDDFISNFTFYGPLEDSDGNQVTATGVTDINFNDYVDGHVDHTVYEDVYGKSVSVTNFAMNMTGFYVPRKSGTYNFHMEADDGASFRLGNAGTCCGPVSDIIGDTFSIVTENYDSSVVSNQGVVRHVNFSVSLDAGKIYPIEIVYINVETAAHFNITVQTPDSDTLEEISDVYQYDLTGDFCASTTITQPWTGTYTTTYVTEVSSMEEVIIDTPTSRSIVTTPTIAGHTTTVPWTGTEVTTISTNGVVTSYNETFTVPEVTVETPTMAGQTTTVPWTGTEATTVSTNGVVTSYNETFTVPEVTVETPTMAGQTTTVPWTGTEATTVSTNRVVTTYNQTFTVPEVTVETPTMAGQTTTVPWTGTEATTVSTSGVVTSYNKTFTVPEVTVETPTTSTPVVTVTGKTTTVPWTGTDATSVTTNGVVTSYNQTFTIPVVTVETPTVAGQTTTVPWTGTEATTVSTNGVVTSYNQTFTVSEVTVETPTASTMSCVVLFLRVVLNLKCQIKTRN